MRMYYLVNLDGSRLRYRRSRLDHHTSTDMDLTDLHPQDDYSHRFFIWHEWIQVSNTGFSSCPTLPNWGFQANGPLMAENVFDYFASSMFYDKQSNNQVLRMQTMHVGVPISNEAEELKWVICRRSSSIPCNFSRRFTGVEFAVVHAQPPSLFIIHKRERLSPEESKPSLWKSTTTFPKSLMSFVFPTSSPLAGVFHHQ